MHSLAAALVLGADQISRLMDRKTSFFRHWMTSFWTRLTLEQGKHLSLRILATFHGAVGASFAPPGRLSNQRRNLRLCTSRHLQPRVAALSSSHEKSSMAHETRSVSHEPTKASLHPFLTGQTALQTFRPTGILPRPKSQGQSRRSFLHIQTFPLSSSTTTSGRLAQPSHDMIEIPLRRC